MKFFSALLTCLLALSIPALAADPEAAPWKEFHFDDKEAGLSAVVLHRQSTNEWKLQLLSESAKPQPMTLAVRKVIDGDGVLYRIFFWVPGQHSSASRAAVRSSRSTTTSPLSLA